MTNQKHSGYYMQRILNLLPNDSSKIQSKELVTLARKPVYEKSKNGEKKERKGIGPNTLFFYLDRLIKKGLVNKLPVDPEHPIDQTSFEAETLAELDLEELGSQNPALLQASTHEDQHAHGEQQQKRQQSPAENRRHFLVEVVRPDPRRNLFV